MALILFLVSVKNITIDTIDIFVMRNTHLHTQKKMLKKDENKIKKKIEKKNNKQFMDECIL
jgi:hypothetical protein